MKYGQLKEIPHTAPSSIFPFTLPTHPIIQLPHSCEHTCMHSPTPTHTHTQNTDKIQNNDDYRQIIRTDPHTYLERWVEKLILKTVWNTVSDENSSKHQNQLKYVTRCDNTNLPLHLLEGPAWESLHFSDIYGCTQLSIWHTFCFSLSKNNTVIIQINVKYASKSKHFQTHTISRQTSTQMHQPYVYTYPKLLDWKKLQSWVNQAKN